MTCLLVCLGRIPTCCMAAAKEVLQEREVTCLLGCMRMKPPRQVLQPP
jgi:hypothetical protein